MKRLITITCALFCILVAGAAHAQNLKIGTVDMKKIFNAYYKTKDADVKINDARATAEKEYTDQMEAYKETVDEIKRLNDELQAGGLSEQKKDEITKTREEKISEFKDLDMKIQEFRSQREKELEQQALGMRDAIVADIIKVIQTKIKSENYDYVFDKSGVNLDGVPTLIYARQDVDFSDEIIKILNANKKESSSSSSSPSAAPSTTPKSTVLPP